MHFFGDFVGMKENAGAVYIKRHLPGLFIHCINLLCGLEGRAWVGECPDHLTQCRAATHLPCSARCMLLPTGTAEAIYLFLHKSMCAVRRCMPPLSRLLIGPASKAYVLVFPADKVWLRKPEACPVGASGLRIIFSVLITIVTRTVWRQVTIRAEECDNPEPERSEEPKSFEQRWS